MNLFIDIDGVLLGKKTPEQNEICLAGYAEEFLDFALGKFDCYWLTTHCKGDTTKAIDYLSQYGDREFISLAKKVKPTNFKTFKTEALFGDFYWIDDQPMAYEIQYLDERGWLKYWLQVNTRNNYNELSNIIKFLEDI